MKLRTCRTPAGRQRGVAAIELALVMINALLLVPVLLSLGSVFWYYNALQKGLHDANRYLATVPAAEASAPAYQSLAVHAAQTMVVDAAAAAGLDAAVLPLPSYVSFLCDGFTICGSAAAVPGTIRSAALVQVSSAGVYEGLVVDMLGQQVDVTLTPDSVQRYGD